MFSESYLTKYEAYLTDIPLRKWNKILPYIGLATQIITGIFLMVTAIGIKIFFRFNTKLTRKPRIKNTISFKRLNIIYSLGLIFSAFLHLVLMKNESAETYVMHYTVSLVINSMLCSLILSDKDARAFFKTKFLAWKDENLFYMRKINFFTSRYKISPAEGTSQKSIQDGSRTEENFQSMMDIGEHETDDENVRHDVLKNLTLDGDFPLNRIETPALSGDMDMNVIDIE